MRLLRIIGYLIAGAAFVFFAAVCVAVFLAGGGFAP